MVLGKPTVRTFAPEQMGQVECFSFYCSVTYKFNGEQKRALGGVSRHFEKAQTFQSLAVALRPSLDIDHQQVEELSYTPADNARQLAAVIEAAITELYSSIDCTAKVLHAIYAKDSRKFKESTRKLFEQFDQITGAFPEEIKEILRHVPWYPGLLFLRDELTHRGAGRCDMDRTTKVVQYFHDGIKVNGRPFVVPDVYEWLIQKFNEVNNFLGLVFRELRKTLKTTPVVQVCGLVEGRMLVRMVDPTQPINFANGTCGSYQWFEKDEFPACPFVTECGAYKITRPGIDPASLFPKEEEKPPPDNSGWGDAQAKSES